MTDTNTTTRGVPVLSMAEIVAKSPDPVEAIRKLGTSIARSQMMGPTERPEVGEVLVMLCITNGMTLAELFRTHQISFGRLEKRIDAAVAEFRGKGGKIEWIDDGAAGQQARAKFVLGDESVEASCSVAEAHKAGWTINKKWIQEPVTMLRARVKKRGILALCPEIFFGEEPTEDRDTTQVTVDSERMAASAAAAAAAPRPTPPPAKPPEPKPAPAAALPPAAAPATPPAAPVAATSPAPSLSDELQAKLVEIIGVDNIPTAQAWAESVGWLAKGAGLDQLAEKNAASIIAKPDRFRAKLETFKQGGAK